MPTSTRSLSLSSLYYEFEQEVSSQLLDGNNRHHLMRSVTVALVDNDWRDLAGGIARNDLQPSRTQPIDSKGVVD